MNDIKKLFQAVVADLYNKKIDIEFSRTDEKFGDFTSNIALQLAKLVDKSPRQVAEQIIEKIDSAQIASMEVAGPGFINITLTAKTLLELSRRNNYHEHKRETVVIETNNPNPFKAMHIGHAYNAVLGDTLANLIELRGSNTYRVSYHGDIGLHVGKSMYSLLRYVDNDIAKLNNIEPDERNAFMSKMYAEGAKSYSNDENAKKEIINLAKESFTRTDKTYAEIYDTCFRWSFELLDKQIMRLGNKPVDRRFLESDADARGVAIVKNNTPKVFKHSDGAYVFEGSKYGAFDNVFVSSQGTGLYASRDLGLMELKNEYYHPDKSYIITAEEQKDYFKGVIIAAELCDSKYKDQTVNIPTGMVKLPSGKMSSRSGEVVEIAWLFDEVSKAVVRRGGQPDDESVSAVLRYEFLKVRIGGDIVFDIDRAVDIKGNSGPYLQYAHARARSILAKEKFDSGGYELVNLLADERSLLRKISEYNEVLAKAAEELLPHYVCNYLYELAQIFNRFYEKNKVIGDKRQTLRLYLLELYADKIKHGLEVLGISAPNKM